MMVDVSVEVSVLARLMGVPVVTMVLPGSRSDQPHRLGYALAAMLIAKPCSRMRITVPSSFPR